MGPHHPCGSIAEASRIVLASSRSFMIVSPGIIVVCACGVLGLISFRFCLYLSFSVLFEMFISNGHQFLLNIYHKGDARGWQAVSDCNINACCWKWADVLPLDFFFWIYGLLGVKNPKIQVLYSPNHLCNDFQANKTATPISSWQEVGRNNGPTIAGCSIADSVKGGAMKKIPRRESDGGPAQATEVDIHSSAMRTSWIGQRKKPINVGGLVLKHT